MHIFHKIATGVVPLVAMTALAGATSPAGATSEKTTKNAPVTTKAS